MDAAVLMAELESGDGPHEDVAALFVAGQICEDCWRRPADEDHLCASCAGAILAAARMGRYLIG